MTEPEIMSAEALLPCPFCGASARAAEKLGGYPVYFVKCGSCGSETDKYVSADAAAVAWNRRALPPVEDAEIAGLLAPVDAIADESAIISVRYAKALATALRALAVQCRNAGLQIDRLNDLNFAEFERAEAAETQRDAQADKLASYARVAEAKRERGLREAVYTRRDGEDFTLQELCDYVARLEDENWEKEKKIKDADCVLNDTKRIMVSEVEKATQAIKEREAAEQRERVLIALVRDAYNEGFGEGMNEFQKPRNGGKPWQDSGSKRKLAALSPTEGAT